MSDKNEIIRSAAAQVTENYRKSDILMYGDALRLPSRTAVIEIIRDFQKILFPAYYGDRDLLKLPPEQYSALLMGHVYDKLLRQLELVMPEGEGGARRAEKVCEAMMERLPHIQELLLKDLTAPRPRAGRRSFCPTQGCLPSSSIASRTSCILRKCR